MPELVQIGGLLSLIVGMAHFTFPTKFGWNRDFALVSEINAKSFYTIHLFLIPFFFFFAGAALFYTEQMGSDPMGRYFTGCFALFWLARGLWQIFYYHGVRRKMVLPGFHYAIIIVSFFSSFCFSSPWIF